MSSMIVTDSAAPRRTGAAELRAAFDRAFAEPAGAGAVPSEDFVVIRADGADFALRLAEITGLHADKKVTRVPADDPALVGLAGFRGVVLPVYSLAALLGRSTRIVPRWLVIAATAPVVLAFDAFDTYLRVAAEAIEPRRAGTTDRPYVRDFISAGSAIRPILHLPSILDAIGTRRPAASPAQER